MDLTVGPSFAMLFRWLHIAAGILWVACLISFSFVSARDVNRARQKKVAPEPMRRALPVLRWGAASTWVSGMVLTLLGYYALDQLVRHEVRLETRYGLTVDFTRATDEPVIGRAAGIVISLTVIALSSLAYEAVWRTLRTRARIAGATSYLLFVVTLYVLSRFFTGRAVFMHAGALLGTAMAMNVWMRGGLARSDIVRRSRQNAYMSVPAVLAMLATHDAAISDREDTWAVMAIIVAVSWAATAWLLGRSASAMVAAPSS
ncbi:MAG: urate hydroxylase PuuD [Anaeromyxobacteraceae bacterium]